MANTGLPAGKNALTKLTASSCARSLSGLPPPGMNSASKSSGFTSLKDLSVRALTFALVTLELRARLQADDRHLMPRLAERVVRVFELRVLEPGTENTGDSHATP